MISFDLLTETQFELELPANAPARIEQPVLREYENWWKIGTSTWIEALPQKSMRAVHQDSGDLAEIRFCADKPSLEILTGGDWAIGSDAWQGLAAQLLGGVVDRVDASVPSIPVRRSRLRGSEKTLAWPSSGDPTVASRRQIRTARSKSLETYFEVSGNPEVDVEDGDQTAQASRLRRALQQYLSTPPRPAAMRLSLTATPGAMPELACAHGGRPTLLWGADRAMWNPDRGLITTRTRDIEAANLRRNLGASAQLLALATAVEAATGGIECSMRFVYTVQVTKAQRWVAELTVLPDQWGYDMAQWVRMVLDGICPEGVRVSKIG
jgi:hypothetical protein